MKLTQFKSGGRLAIPAIFAALFLVASTITLYYYSATLSKKGLYAIAGTQENYSWSIAKFSIKLAEFETFVEQQKNSPKVDIEALRLRFEILYSRFYVLETVSESTQPLYREPGYPQVIQHMLKEMDRLDRLISASPLDLSNISQAMQHMKPYAIEMANLADHAEVKQRTVAYDDYIEKRLIIFYGLVIIMFSVIALVAITLIVLRQQRITIEQQAKAIEAEKATRTKNAFLGAIGHELRTSLQSIMSAIDVLMNTKVSAEHVDTFQRLETAAQQIESQMKDLTDYAHLDSGMMELRIVPFNAERLIQETADEIGMLTRKAHIKLLCEVDFSHAQVYSDPLRIRQILVNLLTNAYKYTENGSITVHGCLRRQPGGNALIIEVTDTGIGIEEEKLGQIFQPFTQLDQSHTKQYGGVGMGLAIVQGLVSLLQGSVTVYSEQAKGSTFIVSIPVDLGDAQPDQAEHPLTPAATRLKEQQVLVVDDNKSVGDAFAALLDKLGYRHEQCDSPERALQKLLRRPYDALLLDLQMPGIDGAALAKKLRNQRGPNRHIPIIGISAYTPELLTAEQRAMFDDYLMKPVRMDALSNALAALFAKG
ncbi:ATP-binding response regulator [Serratia odorifera]|jgi:signal transduction histidine kinase|uniref:histidine kinase n=2 Tax=Serratia odorifera TaxID=618 RepID=D4DYV7_SEROD|nr:ATP-binding protein [Serratia odorifera]EFE97279.1 ATPase/histidine kinase/DNA gyrase B/HSP90 domain protein [Serratia odorifera DSM 4582]MBJ2066589.1 response regulator [Serratia odorifera]PNK91758.1 hybrid sensor histidine kinase/response regulator [Serratia odorifera]RII72906.1 hybrid sensor histidine kinase/response regulator [Serratia odorifera]VDZ54582.1 Autoinducer 2 sensor kinase/phosphatase luxQ [Serratia odorifera]